MATDDKPTQKQLRYLRALCEATGETTSWPQTRQETAGALPRARGRGVRLPGIGVAAGAGGPGAAPLASRCSTAEPCGWGTHAAPTRQEARWPPTLPSRRPDARSALRPTPPTSGSASSSASASTASCGSATFRLTGRGAATCRARARVDGRAPRARRRLHGEGEEARLGADARVALTDKTALRELPP